MMVAIRSRVQTCPRKQNDSAPRCKTSGRWASRSVDSLRGAPGGGRRCRASGPPSRAPFIHWLTAPSLTPNSSTIPRRDHPRCLSFHACRRSRSFELFGEMFKHGSVSPAHHNLKVSIFGAVNKASRFVLVSHAIITLPYARAPASATGSGTKGSGRITEKSQHDYYGMLSGVATVTILPNFRGT